MLSSVSREGKIGVYADEGQKSNLSLKDRFLLSPFVQQYASHNFRWPMFSHENSLLPYVVQSIKT
jgi:hypothetical protein